jgi:hypothetical protein
MCRRVSLLGIFYWGINKIIKEMGKGPGEGGSGVALGLSASLRLDANQSIN